MSAIQTYVQSLEKKRIAVFGLARSGLSVIRAFADTVVEIIAWDDSEGSRKKAAALGADLQELNPETLKDCAFLVLAPGVPLDFPKPHPVVTAARKAGVEIICDIELFSRVYPNLKTVGITGTNGKSTTTALTGHVLKKCGIKSEIGGNIGKPVFDLDVSDTDILVLELSSYQLDLCPHFHPDIAVLLNITPDHLDRHGTMENYAATKAQIFEGKGQAFITGKDSYSQAILQDLKAQKNRNILPLFNLQEIEETSSLRGDHNRQNIQAVLAIAGALNLDKKHVEEAIRNFPGLPHRQYVVRQIGRVTYVNDSKATNAEAAEKALSSFENIYWIAGGQPKDGGLKGLEPLMPRVAHAFLIGQAADEFAQWMKNNDISHSLSGTLEKAVEAAHQMAQNGGEDAVVLLSPACASFDQFSSFEERGDAFTHLVQNLESNKS